MCRKTTLLERKEKEGETKVKKTKYVLFALSIIAIVLLSVATSEQQMIAPNDLDNPYQSINFTI